jgi:hypothetical protein
MQFKKILCLTFLCASQIIASEFDHLSTKPLFIVFHGLGGNGQFGEEVARQFSELAPIHFNSGPVNRGEQYELYSPNAENGQWIDPTFALNVMPTLDAPTREAFLTALTLDNNGDFNVDTLGNPDVSMQIANINTRINEITSVVHEQIGTSRKFNDVVFMGQSLGGITASLVANKLTKQHNQQFGALIVDSAPIVWLNETNLRPIHVVVNTPTNDNFFKDWFNVCWDRISTHQLFPLNLKRHNNTENHCDMPVEFKLDAARALIDVIETNRYGIRIV